jgi:hypothetical protein
LARAGGGAAAASRLCTHYPENSDSSQWEMRAVPDEEYLDGIRSSTNQYRKGIDQALERFGARSFFARHGLKPDGFRLFAGRHGRHPFADVHPFCCAAALDQRLLSADAPHLAVDFVVLLKYFRALYDWQRWHLANGVSEGLNFQFDAAVRSWLDSEFALGISFESDKGRARFIEERWKEFAFPLELAGRTWEPESWTATFHQCQAEFDLAVVGMFDAIDSMAREVLVWADARGLPFSTFWQSCYERHSVHHGAEAPKLAMRPEFMWIPAEAHIPDADCLRYWYQMAGFAVADMFVRRIARKERPIGSGRAGLCAYLAAGALGANLSVFRGVFGGDTITLDNALILKKRFGHDFDKVLRLLLDGKMAFEIYERTGRAPRSLM